MGIVRSNTTELLAPTLYHLALVFLQRRDTSRTWPTRLAAITVYTYTVNEEFHRVPP